MFRSEYWVDDDEWKDRREKKEEAGRKKEKKAVGKEEEKKGDDNERQACYTAYHLLIIRYPSSTPKKPFRADRAKPFSSAKSVILTVRFTLSGFRK